MILIHGITNNVIKSIAIVLFLSSCTNNSPNQVINNSHNLSTITVNNKQLKKLALVVNGEDFIRQGFISKDGWKINFNHGYVTLNNVVAHQTSQLFNPETQTKLTPTESVTLINTPTTVDLAKGDENAVPIVVTEVPAKSGFYNAITWNVINPSKNGSSIILAGNAQKQGKTINFVLNFALDLNYICGEFIGEERKGILTENQSAEVEITFHLDHVFGDLNVPKNDELNLKAVGFEPLAILAKNGQLKANLHDFNKQLSQENYQKLEKSLLSLGHVGEGDCRLTKN